MKRRKPNLERQRALATKFPGYDLHVEAEKMWKVLFGKGKVPSISLHTRSGGTGWAHHDRRITVGVATKDVADVLIALLHELVHVHVGLKENHNWRFNMVLAEAAKNYWGIRVESYRVQGYDLTHKLVPVLRAYIELRERVRLEASKLFEAA